MKRGFAHLLTRMYPRRWRERYGEEFEDFLIEGRGDLRTWVDVIRAAVEERVHPTHIDPTQGGVMSEVRTTSFGTVVRQPSALIPLMMALTALAVVMIHIGVYGAAQRGG